MYIYINIQRDNMKKRLILDVHSQLHADIKSRAAREGKSIKQFIIELLIAHLMNKQDNKN